jgi:acyl-CoA synthetase (NDP forming)
MELLFRPRHVAVIGASRTPGKLGHSVLRNLVNGGYPGRVSAINPAGTEVNGRPGYRSLKELPEPADCAFLAIPAAAIPEAVRECAAAGVRYAVLGASGFAELGTEEGAARQREMTEAARASGLRLVGPNTNGILSAPDRLSLGYNASHAERFAPGTVSFVSHSGALMDGMVRRLYRAGGGLSKFVAAGNEADLGMLDYLEYLLGDPTTEVIGLVIEALNDAPRFLRLARAAQKPIVALKIGRSALGAHATAAHSSRLAGSARAYAALFREAGIATVPTVEALAGACALLATSPRGGDRRMVCVTTSGAGGALLADFAGERGMPLAGTHEGGWDAPVQAGLSAIRTLAPVRNPIDLGSVGGDWSALDPILRLLENHGMRGPALAYAHSAAAPGWDENMADALIDRRRRCGTPVLVLAPGGLRPEIEARYAQGGVPVYHDTFTCFETLQSWYHDQPASEAGAPPRLATKIGLPVEGNFLDEARSAAVLRQAGVPMVRSETVASLAEARTAAQALGYPVVLKALAPGVAHKSRHGLVAVGLRDAAALEQAFDAMAARVASPAPFLVQPMVASKAELVIGVSHEEPLGYFLVFGLGGVHTEALDQVGLLPIPSSPAAIRARLAASLLGKIAPVEKVGRVLEALQALVLDHTENIESIDINPLLVTEHGCVAVDALIVFRQHQQEKMASCCGSS